jgi:hypothetical protein
MDIFSLPPASCALVIVLCTICTTVSANVLVGAAVLSFVVSFFSALNAFFILALGNECNEEDVDSTNSTDIGNVTATTNQTSSSDGEEEETGMEEFCDIRAYLGVMAVFSALLWLGAGLYILKIPQPGNYATGQTTTFGDAPDSTDDQDDREVVPAAELT